MISLIIPVYNKAPFLKRCLASVADQSNKTAQIIVIDDGSTDGSAKICDYYEKMIGFEVYHTENRGVSAARNYGIEKAKGDYIAFLDDDDVLMPGAIGMMVRAARRGYNICQFGHYRCRWFEEFNPLKQYRALAQDYSFDYIPKYWVQVWNKLYKRQFLLKNKIEFKKGMQFGEDTLFNARCILANGGITHIEGATILHCLDDQESLCRGGSLTLERVKELDAALCRLLDEETDERKIEWLNVAINEHRRSKLYKRLGFWHGDAGKHDVVYFVKDSSENEELVYSLRSLEENWQYKRVWFCGGCPRNLKPDAHFKPMQSGIDKWSRVRWNLRQVCENDDITEDFWLFNDDFFVLKKIDETMPPLYNGELSDYIARIEKKIGGPDGYTERLKVAVSDLHLAKKPTLNYEVHKPMLINRKKALEVMEAFLNTPAFRSLYGNYWNLGGVDCHDMKVKVKNYGKIERVTMFWDFVSTSDESFREGDVGEFIRGRFTKKTRFERS